MLDSQIATRFARGLFAALGLVRRTSLSVVLDERYADLAAQFQREQVELLRKALKKHNVVGKVARDICGEFTFDLSMLFDQGEFDLGGEAYRPSVAFTTDEDTFYVQPADVEYHEYAFGTTADVFESEKP